jgi:hypothetical protein
MPNARRPALGLLLAVAGCGGGASNISNDELSQSAQPIVYGALDSTHTAVVALLANAGGGGVSLCTGTVVQVANGLAYVLTAAHCCTPTPPSLVVTGTDYSVGVQYLAGGTPQPPTYAVVAGSVTPDPAFTPTPVPQHDFCVLQFTAPANQPAIPVALPGQDGLSLGVNVEHVGYGITQNNSNNSLRYTGTGAIDQALSATDFQYTVGGAQHVPGPCSGDSGGPGLFPAGAAQAQQKVVGVISYGDANCLVSGSDERVSAETGPGGFIAATLGLGGMDAGTGSDGGVDAGQTPPDAGGARADGGGQAPDAGGAHTTSSGCGCGNSGAGGPALVGLMALLRLMRRRPLGVVDGLRQWSVSARGGRRAA